MDETEEFARLIAGLRAGDPGCAEALCRRYAPFIQAAVRRQLHPRLRPRFDSLDFVQDVWASFLAIPADRYTFDTPQALHGFLTQMAYFRVVEVFRRRFGTDADAIVRELTVAEAVDRHQLQSPAPTPSQWAIAGEEWERILGRFPAGHRVILERLREGFTHEDIARMTDVSLSTVNRIVRRLKDLTGL